MIANNVHRIPLEHLSVNDLTGSCRIKKANVLITLNEREHQAVFCQKMNPTKKMSTYGKNNTSN